MAHSYHHAVSSAKRYGGEPDDYLALHSFMDSSKSAWADQRHRAVLHHNFGIYVAEQVFGLKEEVRLLRKAIDRVPRWLQRMLGIRPPQETPVTLTLYNGKQVPIRLVAEQHVIEDCGFIPSLEQYLGEMPRQKWMYRGAMPISRILERADAILPSLENAGAPTVPTLSRPEPLPATV
jgi:hypothetical protein